jgi:ankyrin repeat protein
MLYKHFLLLVWLCVYMHHVCAMTTPLHSAVNDNNQDVVSDLISKHFNVNVRDKMGYTPLHNAAYYGHSTIAFMLIKSGAEVNARDPRGDTPLHSAAFWGQYGTVCTLCAQKAALDASNKYGDTPLHYAALRGRCEIVQKLLELDADITIRNDDGDTPFHCAVKNGSIGAVGIFIDYSIKKKIDLLSLRNKDAQTALDVAYEKLSSSENIGDRRRTLIVQLLKGYSTGLA